MTGVDIALELLKAVILTAFAAVIIGFFVGHRKVAPWAIGFLLFYTVGKTISLL